MTTSHVFYMLKWIKKAYFFGSTYLFFNCIFSVSDKSVIFATYKSGYYCHFQKISNKLTIRKTN